MSAVTANVEKGKREYRIWGIPPDQPVQYEPARRVLDLDLTSYQDLVTLLKDVLVRADYGRSTSSVQPWPAGSLMDVLAARYTDNLGVPGVAQVLQRCLTRAAEDRAYRFAASVLVEACLRDDVEAVRGHEDALGGMLWGAQWDGSQLERAPLTDEQDSAVLCALHAMRSPHVLPTLLRLPVHYDPTPLHMAVMFDYDFAGHDAIAALIERYQAFIRSHRNMGINQQLRRAEQAAEELRHRYAERSLGFERMLIGPHHELGRLYRNARHTAVFSGWLREVNHVIFNELSSIADLMPFLPDARILDLIRAGGQRLTQLRNGTDIRIAKADVAGLMALAHRLASLQLPARVAQLRVPDAYSGPRLAFYRCD